MTETAIDRARRLLATKTTADILADIFPRITVIHRNMDDRAFVDLCLTILSAHAVFTYEGDQHAQAEAVERGRIRRGGKTYDVRAA